VGNEKLYNIFIEKLEGKKAHSEDQGLDGRKIVWESVDWIHAAQIGNRGGSCEHGNAPSGSINVGEYFD
jgi:hypothetical protein